MDPSINQIHLSMNSEETSKQDWQSTHGSKLRNILKTAAEAVLLQKPNNASVANITKSTAERQLDYGLSTFHIMTKHVSMVISTLDY